MNEQAQDLKKAHDSLLEAMPESASHDKTDCPFCNMQSTDDHGGNMSETFTHEEVEARISAAVAAATKELSDKLSAFEASQSAAEVDAKIAEARSEAEEKVSTLQADLDAKVIELEQARAEHQGLVDLLEKAEADREASEAAEARKEERTAQVAGLSAFPEKYITENADRWAAMSDEVFEATLADYKAVAEKNTVTPGRKIPAKTALHATEDSPKGASALHALSEMRRSGFDPRQVVR